MTDATPPRPDATADPRTGQAYLLFAVSLLLVVLLGSVVQLWSFRPGLAITELGLILLPAVLFVRRKRLPVAESLGWRRVAPAIVLLSLALGVTAWGAAAAMELLMESMLGPSPTIEGFLPRTLPDLFYLLAVGALLPGLCEETLFRGAIQGVLGRRGPWRGVVITAALFAVFHVNPWILLPAFFLGLVFGALVLRTGSTLPAILAHLATNATAFSVTYAYRDRTDSEAYLLIGLLSALCVAVVPLVWLRTRTTAAAVAPPLLASVPAAIERPRAWLAALAGGAALLVVTALVAAAILLVEFHTVADDSLAPDARRGDQLVLFTGKMDMDLEAGDIVGYRRDGEAILGRIARVDADTVWVLDGPVERAMPRREIVSKVVHRMEGSEAAVPEPARSPEE